MPRALKEVGWFFVNAAQLVWFLFFCAFNFFLGLLVFFITWNPDSALSLGRTFMGPIDFLFGFSRLVIEGEENFPEREPYLIMMNHQSMLDIIIAWMICPLAVRFIAKKALAYVPVIGWTMVIFGMVWIDRGNARSAIKSLKRAALVMKKGHVLCAFPEGTRTRDGHIAPFKKGVFILAVKSGVPIVPVALDGASVMLPRKGWKPRPNTVRVRIGRPIPTVGIEAAGRDALMARVRTEMVEMHRAIGGKGASIETTDADDDVGAAAIA